MSVSLQVSMMHPDMSGVIGASSRDGFSTPFSIHGVNESSIFTGLFKEFLSAIAFSKSMALVITIFICVSIGYCNASQVKIISYQTTVGFIP